MRHVVRQATCAAALVAAAGGLVAAKGTSAGAARAGGRAAHPAHASTNGLDVLPFPGTPDAAPGTEIDFPAVSPAQLVSVKVIGSHSGLHAGRLSAQPAGQGTAFLPRKPFLPGERVRVIAKLSSGSAAIASGAPGHRRLRFSFRIARPARAVSSAASASSLANFGVVRQRRHSGSGPKTHTFVTEPSFHPPVVTMSGKDGDPGAGDIFLDAGSSGQNAVYMLGPQGSLLWYRPTAGDAYNLREQTYQGHPVLTYWQGKLICPPCGGDGQDVILNNAYQTTHTITPGNGLQSRGADQHEFTLTKQGTALITVFQPVQANLSKVGGPNPGTLDDWIIQEVNVATGKVVWEWHAFGHIPLTDSYFHYIQGQPFDAYHLNSIQELSDGHIIVSVRNTWGVYSIDKKTGKILWKLGGKHPSFHMGAGTNFAWQHDAQLHNNGLLTVFDDGSYPQVEKQSRALEVHLDIGRHQATLVRADTHNPPVVAGSGGSTQLLFNRNVFVGWGYGSLGGFTEFTGGGGQMFTGSFASPIQSYRSYRFGWTGAPPQQPAVAATGSKTAGDDVVYVSWNGATRVAKWQVLAATSINSPFSKVASVPWAAFETGITVTTGKGKYFEVQALDAKGNVLPHGTSTIVHGP